MPDPPSSLVSHAREGEPRLLIDADERRRAERELDAIGRAVPVHARAAWGEAFSDSPSALAAMHVPGTGYVGGIGVVMLPSRAMPGHQIWRVDRVSDVLGVEHAAALLQYIAASARRRRRVLRVDVSVASRDAAFRSALAAMLARVGFKQIPTVRTSGYTLVVELGDEEAMLASLSKQTRRNIRAIERQPVVVRPVDNPQLADRMHALMRETMARTGGTYEPVDWEAAMHVSRELPDRSRLVGMERTDTTSPERLLAFMWAHQHGQHAVYDAGASTRQTDLKITMADPLMWDIIRWARSTGARWFDLGGVSRPVPGAADPLAGISDFKRSFSRQVEEVGDEYVIDVAPVRSAVARALGTGVRAIRRLATR